MEVNDKFHAPTVLPSGKVLLVPVGWVDPRAGLDMVVKKLTIIQPIAQRYTTELTWLLYPTSTRGMKLA
jgi:hypothetical protein